MERTRPVSGRALLRSDTRPLALSFHDVENVLRFPVRRRLAVYAKMMMSKSNNLGVEESFASIGRAFPVAAPAATIRPFRRPHSLQPSPLPQANTSPSRHFRARAADRPLPPSPSFPHLSPSWRVSAPLFLLPSYFFLRAPRASPLCASVPLCEPPSRHSSLVTVCRRPSGGKSPPPPPSSAILSPAARLPPAP